MGSRFILLLVMSSLTGTFLNEDVSVYTLLFAQYTTPSLEAGRVYFLLTSLTECEAVPQGRRTLYGRIRYEYRVVAEKFGLGHELSIVNDRSPAHVLLMSFAEQALRDPLRRFEKISALFLQDVEALRKACEEGRRESQVAAQGSQLASSFTRTWDERVKLEPVPCAVLRFRQASEHLSYDDSIIPMEISNGFGSVERGVRGRGGCHDNYT